MKRTFNLLVLVTLLALTFGALGFAPAQAAPAPKPLMAPPAYYPFGPQTGVNQSALTGWTLCWSSTYNTSTDTLASILAACNGDYLLLAGGQTGNPVLDVLAAAPRADVIFDTGTGNTPHDANGSGWYYNNSWSWGFANQGDPLFRASCDYPEYYGNFTNLSLRLCWHTGGVYINGGFRSGATIGLNGSTAYTRYIYHAFDAPSDTTPPVVTVPSDITAEATSASGAAVNFTVSATDETSPANPAVTCDWNSGDTFPLGTTPVTCEATDDAVNIGYGYFNVIVEDTTAPIFIFMPNNPHEATSASGAVPYWGATVSDAVSGMASSSCSNVNEALYPIGTTTVNCTGTDNAGNTATGSFDVIVVDTTPPVTYWDSTPPSLTNSTSADFTFHSDDLVSDSANIEHVCFLDAGPDWFICSSPLNLSGLSEGFHFIWMYANDEAGNSNYGPGLIGYGWTIDLTAPVFALVADNPYEATGPTGAIALYNASFSDDNGIASQSCTPASGSLFPLGPNLVDCNGTDNAGNSTQYIFQIIVIDSTAPTLSLPADITVPQNNPSGATVPYIATANDIVDASPSVSCVPASGSNFPLGTTTVNCSATDDFDNTSYDSFNVTVFAWTAGTFTSVGGYDGTFIETNETSGIGTAPNIPGGFLDSGDTVLSNRQTLNVMHFDTSTLPDGAVVLGLSIQVKQYQIVGTNPMTTHGNLNVDIVSPFFGTGMSLVASDFQAPASAANVGFFNTTPLPGNWFQAVLDSGAFPFLNLTGSTQFRAHFALDDDNDGRADLFRVYSGNSPLAANRPVLTVYYYIP